MTDTLRTILETNKILREEIDALSERIENHIARAEELKKKVRYFEKSAIEPCKYCMPPIPCYGHANCYTCKKEIYKYFIKRIYTKIKAW